MYDFAFGETKARGELALGPELQRDRQMLNATVSLMPGTLAGQAQSTFQAFPPNALKSFRAPTQPDEDSVTQSPGEVSASFATPPRIFDLLTRQEQAPNPDSRVTLGAERDALGMPRVKLDWRLTELDRRSFQAFYEVLGRELGRSGVGRVRMRDWVMEKGPSWPSSLGGGWHHMGTTRMHADPKRGVVDANCRVHGVGNLYVAGASVYPTAGCANPTLTLVALSLRLSDHLESVLG
jgi:choline dehydrogenase-like flavoprotein